MVAMVLGRRRSSLERLFAGRHVCSALTLATVCTRVWPADPLVRLPKKSPKDLRREPQPWLLGM